MGRGLRPLVALLALLAMAEARADDAARARVDYLLHCSGCHGVDGTGKPTRGIPRFTGQVGHFTRLPEGRAFLLQVPGLLSAGLTDARAAAVTNWMLRAFAGDSLPAAFVPYTPEEARAYRLSRPADIAGHRKALYERLLAEGARFIE